MVNDVEKNISDLIGLYAEKTPTKIAIQHHASTITYQELALATDQLAATISSKQLGANAVVAVAMDRSIDMSLCLLALLKAGVTYMPIDPTLPLERVSFLMSDSGTSLLITSAAYTDVYHEFPQLSFTTLRLEGASQQFVAKPVDLDHLVYIIYTSGSTGLPKGVGISQRSLLNLLQHRLISPGMSSNDHMLGLTTMSFDISEEELYLPLIAGAKLTIVDHDITRDGAALLELVKNEKITFMQATPYIWQMMIEAGWKEKLPIVAFCGGEALTKKLAQQLLDRCASLWNMYGPTETTICALAKKIEDVEAKISIGKPIANTQVYILNDTLEEVEPGIEGELFIGGLGVAKGYINRPELTAEKFLSIDISGLKQRVYRTGDLVKMLSNGELQFVGRIDTQVKIRGYRIETEEIDHHLKAQENIKDALVVVHQDVVNNARLIAYLVLKDKADQAVFKNIKEELKQRLTQILPAYMVPVDYVLLTQMPLLPSGKIDKKALPAPSIENNSTDHVAPLTATEKTIAEIWSKHIGIADIGLHDNFFDLGGSSLVALKTKIEIEKRLQKRLSPSILFKYPTIKQLVNVIENEVSEEFKALIPIQPDGNKIPLYMVHGIGLNVLGYRGMAGYLDSDQPVYGLQAFNVEEMDTVYNSIESMASFYNAEILKHNPIGPYALSGYSIGGIIAFEMAKQFIAQGKLVKFLGMFDTNVQLPTHQYPLIRKVLAKAYRQYAKLRFRAKSIYKAPMVSLLYLAKTYYQNWSIVFRRQGNFPAYPDYMVHTIKKIMKAFYNYKLEPIPVKIDVFKASNMYFMDDPYFLGWNDYAQQGVDTHKVPGSHAEIFIPPYEEELAKVLQAKLNKINT